VGNLRVVSKGHNLSARDAFRPTLSGYATSPDPLRHRIRVRATMSALPVVVDESPNSEDIAAVAQGMRRHALSQIEGDESPPIACFARESGVVVGGIVGRVIKQRLFVDLLWVEETQRNHGLGSSLLQCMERVASERGCRDVLLETLSDSAARLYSALGYRLMAEVPDYVPGFAKRVLLKTLA